MKVKHLYFIAALLSLGLNSPLFGQAGYVDTSYYKGRGVDFKCTGGIVLPDSSVMAIGRFGWANERFISGVVKFTKTGEIDYSFNVGTGADEHVNQIVRQPDGKLIIAGDFRTFNGDSVFHIIRLNSDGTRDNTFNMGSGFTTNGTVYALHLQPDGKIMVGGIFTSYNGTTANYIVRLNPNGSIDNTFNTGTGFNNTVYCIDRQVDGKYVVAGNFTSINGDTLYKRIVRLNANGNIDASFVPGAGFNNIVTRAHVQNDGKIVAVGFFTAYDVNNAFRIIRLNSTGSVDGTFNAGGGFNSNVNDLLIQPDGKIFATGNFTTYKGVSSVRIVKIDSTGSKDASFNPGAGLNLSCNAVFADFNNKVFVGGTFTQADSFARFRLVRFLSTGKIDQTFFTESKLNNQTYVSEAQSTGKVIVGGSFTRYNSYMANRIVRLNSDGSIDTTFKSGTGANSIIRTIKILSNDKILIGGDFTSYNGKAYNRIARLNSDGTLDTTFSVGTGASASVYSIAVTTQGKIYLGGNFVLYNGDSVFRIVRLNSNGSRDNTFLSGVGFNNYPYELVLQPDGKILAGGAFTSYKGVTTNRIIRLNTDGSADNTFVVGTGAGNIVYAIELTDSGRILIAGSFTTYKGVSKPRIAMLNSDGSLFAPFIASVTNGVVFDVKRVGLGYLLAGTFTTVNGTTKTRLCFVDSLGNINSTAFYVGSGADNQVSNIFVDPIQKGVFLAGTFTTVQYRLFNRFARLSNSNIRITYVATTLCPGAITKVYFDKTGAYNSGNVFTVQLSDSTGSFANPVNIGAKSSSLIGSDSVTVYFPSNLPVGTNYRIRIVSSSPEDISNLSPAILVTTPQQPTITASGPLAFCGNDSVVLTSSAGNTYSWSDGSSTPTVVVKITGTYTVTVNNNNCIAASSPVSTNVIAAPDSSIDFEIASLCGSGSVKLSGQPGYTYSWNIGPTSQSITVSQNGVYTLTVTDSTGCKADSTVNLNFTALFNNLAYASSSTDICEGNTVALFTYPGANSYQWSNGDADDSTTVSTAGNYNVTVSDGICSKTSNTIAVTVKPKPTVTFSLPQDTFCSTASSITLTANPVGGVFNGAGVNASTFNPSGLGDSIIVVTYTYTAPNGCLGVAIDEAYVAICTGIEDMSENAISVFPNPATEHIYISGLQAKAYHIEVSNALGAVMVKMDLEGSAGTEKINLHQLAQGHYFISINAKKFRFIKQ
jgi:uncharacterized delta-60 repeat protein